MKMEGLLPIGSVVLLEKSSKRMMIIGYLQQQVDTQQVWDYVGLPYPEGYMGSERTYLFNHDQITRLFAIGYQDEEQFSFSTHLEKAVDGLRQEKE